MGKRVDDTFAITSSFADGQVVIAENNIEYITRKLIQENIIYSSTYKYRNVKISIKMK